MSQNSGFHIGIPYNILSFFDFIEMPLISTFSTTPEAISKIS
ncbi:hypothetical protein LEP1GSC016_0058 [Leptospira borgpetersenii serovar Hardjo-bovis str. Sponselee]|nr:hypothetical protein LBBP_00827 [Leptospira borgpetersenii serovar Ballum]EKQ92802.1 hypothetical protein LEP1GSC101_3918 [Leptospira borgpetersenii str. UI 09149]EMJ80890.1 hypothetical protein LEP1GSC016_0058 [Leptospira borgpetersenii serovar Hardjo-bovis str. Sponselee]EMK09387.1 hypothetical protein LEP1GSC066_1401 [Leptospira sp. serovar Kenya str. Sh9]EMN11594.1 hypothetical protein LEP1GSC055_1526 [Leptospira borgpetersenii str. Brem 307]EMN17116.1 hypothetical protein LEP1GSC056_14